MEENRKDSPVARASLNTFGATLSNYVVPTRQSQITNDDFTVKDEQYPNRVFASAEEKTRILNLITDFDKKTLWIGSMTGFSDPEAYQTELTDFVSNVKGRAPLEGDQVTVTDLQYVYQYKSDGTWFLFASAKTGLTKQSELINDDYTVKDANYSSRVFTDAAEKTAMMNHIAALEKKTYFVGSMLDFTDPTAYQTELSNCVQTVLSRAAQEGDQVAVKNLNRIYQYGSDGQWFLFANDADRAKKQSALTNDDNTVKDSEYAGRVFADLTEKTATLTQVDTNKDDIVDLQAEDANLQDQITLLQKKSYWVGSMANFTDPSAYATELTTFVTSKLSRVPKEGDQVSVLDRSEVYQYSSAGDWQVYSNSLTLDKASKTETGIVKVGEGINVDSDGVISVNGGANTVKLKIVTTAIASLDDWVDDVSNVPVGKSVTMYSISATGGSANAAIYRIQKKDADNVVVDFYSMTDGKYFRKIKNAGTWDAAPTEVGGGSTLWGSITGTLSDQADLQTALDGKISTSQIADNLTTDDATKVLSARQGKILNESKLDYTQNADNLTTDDATMTLSGRQGKILNESKIPTDEIVDNLTTDDATKVLSARQGKILNDKFSDGSVTKLGTVTIGANFSTRCSPIYLKLGSPIGGSSRFKKYFYLNGGISQAELYGYEDYRGADIYAPTTAGSKGQMLLASGSGAPTWGSLSYSSSVSANLAYKTLFSGSASSGTYGLTNALDITKYDFISIVCNRGKFPVQNIENFIYSPGQYNSSSKQYHFNCGNGTNEYVMLYFSGYETLTRSYSKFVCVTSGKLKVAYIYGYYVNCSVTITQQY